MTERTIRFFQTQLYEWAAQNPRPMPWKGEKDPYLIWLSEIILQQTRVAQGLPYYEKFRESFPSVHDLASASEDDVFKLWEGLGYYSRARNLHAAAKYISHERSGAFPDTYEAILNLKGVGPYTAAAIASFGFGLPHAVLDGNVFRVLARYFGISEPTDSTAGKKRFAQVAQNCLDTEDPAGYNQAIMDFGALQCVPKNPDCTLCPMRSLCAAHRTGRVAELPVKAKKIKRRDRFFHFLVVENDNHYLLRKRTGKDVWQGLYEFPHIEHNRLEFDRDALQKLPGWRKMMGGVAVSVQGVSTTFKQTLSHQTIYGNFWRINAPVPAIAQQFEGALLVEKARLRDYAFPGIIDLYLREKVLTLELF